ncbi:hypothetical protein COLO4_37739 [Corchorus olitorius]|uniref:Protein kinase domain-containing protein n=1 Tax=Corchorus olitorius TaxID=93759 RepID=A0A1R3FZM7_9ROSI|nr:hypothetical protein COLO4_37739 [Corchorus olitorius]
MKYIRTNSLKRLFSLKRRSSFEEDVVNQNGVFEEEVDNSKESFKVVSVSEHSQRPSWRCFSFEEIFVATNENLVGKGGYAEVYKGVLKDGEEIAVKRLTKASTDERKEKDFLTEIGTIGHVCHPNVLSLLGCCIDNGLYLIFQFSSRGSVASLLHDFGLAKWLPSQWTHHSIAPIEGTFGHLAPEYFMHGIVDEKTDVFAFGVFLLEIISGRKPVDASHQSLHCWAKPLLNREEIEKLVDPRLQGAFDVSQLKRLAFAASLCIRASSAWRPTMNEVLQLSALC